MSFETSIPAISSARVFFRARIGLSTGMVMSWSSLAWIGLDGRDDHRLLEVEGVERDVLVLLELLDELEERRVADDVHALDVESTSRSPNMSRRPRPIVCSGRMLALEVYGRSPTMTVTFCTSQPSRSISTLTMALTGLCALVHPPGDLPRRVEVLLRDLAAAISVDDEELCVAAVGRPELLRVLHPQVVADVVGLGGAVEHDEQHWLLAERLELLAVLAPALDACREVSLVLDAGHVGAASSSPAVMPFIGCLTTPSMIACFSG